MRSLARDPGTYIGYLCLLYVNRGKSLRSRIKCVLTVLPAMISVTAVMMRRMPTANRGVIASPKIVMPKKTAVNGSNAPKMAVGVAPIH